MTCVIAIDAGTTGVRAFAVDADGRAACRRVSASSRNTSPSRVGSSTTPTTSGASRIETLAEVAARARTPRARRSPRSASRTSARRWSCGTARTGRPLPPRDRVAGPAHRGTLRRAARRGPRADDPRAHRPRARSVLLGDEARVAAARRRRRGRRRPRVRHGRHVDPLEPHRRPDGGVHATDPSNASRTMLYDIGARDWSDELCALFDVPRACLPEVAAVERTLRRRPRPIARRGLAVPVSGIAGDQQAALFGQACVEPGMTKNTYGTGSFVLTNVGPTLPEPVDGLLTTDRVVARRRRRHVRDGRRDLRDRRRGPVAARRSRASSPTRPRPDRSPRRCPTRGGVFVVPAFTGLGSPWWDPYARARSSASRAARRAPTSPAPSSRRWRSRPPTSSTRSPRRAAPRRRRCASTAARR